MTLVYPVHNGLYVNLTNRCPCACVFCLRQNGPGVAGSDSLWLPREPSVDEVTAALDAALARARPAEVVFCGYGEPTERLDDLLAVARHVRAVAPGLPIRVNTNGLSDLIAGAPTAARFAGLVDVVSVSLNTPSADEYLTLCRPKFGAAAYPALLKFTEEVARVVPKTVMTIVATPDLTPEKEAACRAICARLGATLRVRRYESA